MQWLILPVPSAGGLGSTPGQGTRSSMLQLRPDSALNKDFFFLKCDSPLCNREIKNDLFKR